MLRKGLFVLCIYFLPNLVWSCINCGVKPKNYIQALGSLQVYSLTNIDETFQNRFGNNQGSELEASFFGLKLELQMQEKSPIALNLSGYGCYACSYAPPFLASEISYMSITFSEPFEGLAAGQNLNDLFMIDPASNYYDPFEFMSFETFQNSDTNRPAEAIYLVFNRPLESNYEGIFDVSLISDGKQYRIKSENVHLKPAN